MTRRTIFLATALAFFVAALPLVKAQAADPRVLGSYSDWSAYVFTENGNKICYMASQPIKSEGDYSRRGDIFALVTHRPAEGAKNVFSYITGYPYKPDSTATLKIDSADFTLFTQDETAWASDPSTDNKIATAIRKAEKMSVKGVSSRGTETKDIFSLKGSAAAHDAISRECGVK